MKPLCDRTGRIHPWMLIIALAVAVMGTVLFLKTRTTETPGPKIVLLGIDGADWGLLEPLIAEGKLPNLARMVKEGASGNLASYGLMMSPQIWTTITTGKHFKEHGVDWFTVKMTNINERADLAEKSPLVPVTSKSRKVPALWDMFSEAGATVGVIGHWATWPATEVNGYMVSDRFSYSRYNKMGGADQYLEYQTYPEDLVEEIRGFVMSPKEVDDGDRSRFMDSNMEEKDWWIQHDIIGEFDISYSQMQSYRRTGLHLLKKGQPDFFTIYFQGVDVISHYFWEFMRPKQAERAIQTEDIKRFGGVIRAFYQYQDDLIGEILDLVSEDTVVIVTSDHGFKDLPFPERSEAHISGWHRINGVILLWGKGVRPGITLEDVDVFDVTPTILNLKHLPIGRDMPGRVIAEAFEEGFLGKPDFIKSHKEMPRVPSVQELRTPMDESMLERLEAIGYIRGKRKR